MSVKLKPIEISAAPGGATVLIQAFVPLPLGPIPNPEEFRENCRVGTDQLLEAIPKLIPELFHWASRLESEHQQLVHLQDQPLEKSRAG
jgi:hypothetical protein